MEQYTNEIKQLFQKHNFNYEEIFVIDDLLDTNLVVTTNMLRMRDYIKIAFICHHKKFDNVMLFRDGTASIGFKFSKLNNN